MFDVAIIGAGPAGLTAGIYASRAGLEAAVFEGRSVGGQLSQTHLIENYPGFPKGSNGFDLAWSIKEQAEAFGVREIDEEVRSVCLEGSLKTLVTDQGSYQARAIVVATGARPRLLGVPGEKELTGRGVSYCATCDGNFFRGRDVVVVGGGDTAVADALYLANLCRNVTLVHRRQTLRAAAMYEPRLAALGNVSFAWNSKVEAILEDDGLVSGVRLRHLDTGEQQEMPCAGVFMAVGTQPNTAFLEGLLSLDAAGYVVADELGRTSAPGVFAAGDVRTKALRQVVTAVSDGANAAHSAIEYLASLEP